MSQVITYANNRFQCFCQVKLDDGERVMVSIASSPSPTIKLLRLGRLGLLPKETLWEWGAEQAGGVDAYVRDVVRVLSIGPGELEHPLDSFRDRLLSFKSIGEVRAWLKTAAQSELAMFQDPYEVLAAYGAVLETGPGPMQVADVQELPCSKAEIKSAIMAVLRSTEDPELQTHLYEAYYSLANWQAGVGPRRTGVDFSTYSRDEDVDKFAEEMSDYLNAYSEWEKWAPIVNSERDALLKDIKGIGSDEDIAADINTYDQKGYTNLMHAAEDGDVDRVKTLARPRS